MLRIAADNDDLFAPLEAPQPDIAEGFVVCEFAGISLAIPRVDIVSIEHGGELSAPLPGERVLGWFNSARGPWPAYALDSQLQRLVDVPQPGSFLIFVKSQPWPLGLLCESVRIVRALSELTVQPLPAVMRGTAGMIRGVARIDRQHIALVLLAGGLAAHLGNEDECEVLHE